MMLKKKYLRKNLRCFINRWNNKGAEQIWWVIIAAAIAIFVMILLVIWFKGSGGKSFEVLDKNIAGLDDTDKDHVADLYDKCVCDQGDKDGCPDVAPEQLILLQKKQKSECPQP